MASHILPREGGTGSVETAGDLLAMIRQGHAVTRMELVRATGMSRSTITQRIDALMAADLVCEAGEAPSSGGRPPQQLAFNGSVGMVLVADLGATHSRLAVADLAGDIQAEAAEPIDIGSGPAVVLAWVVEQFDLLLRQAGRDPDDVRGIGIGLPGPVQYGVGRVVNPPIMPGWDGVSIPAVLQAHHDVPVLVDNDVNIMALGEYWTHWRRVVSDLLFIKVGTGIGSGIVADGHIYRGHDGAAGDMGHIRMVSAAGRACRCGNVDCLEAVAGGAALVARLRADGIDVDDARHLASLAQAGDKSASSLVHGAGRDIGEVLTSAINMLNPGAVVLGGDMALAADRLVDGVRERIGERSTALATHGLRVERSRLGRRAGVVGAAVMITEALLAPDAVDALIAS